MNFLTFKNAFRARKVQPAGLREDGCPASAVPASGSLLSVQKCLKESGHCCNGAFIDWPSLSCSRNSVSSSLCIKSTAAGRAALLHVSTAGEEEEEEECVCRREAGGLLGLARIACLVCVTKAKAFQRF